MVRSVTAAPAARPAGAATPAAAAGKTPTRFQRMIPSIGEGLAIMGVLPISCFATYKVFWLPAPQFFTRNDYLKLATTVGAALLTLKIGCNVAEATSKFVRKKLENAYGIQPQTETSSPGGRIEEFFKPNYKRDVALVMAFIFATMVLPSIPNYFPSDLACVEKELHLYNILNETKQNAWQETYHLFERFVPRDLFSPEAEMSEKLAKTFNHYAPQADAGFSQLKSMAEQRVLECIGTAKCSHRDLFKEDFDLFSTGIGLAPAIYDQLTRIRDSFFANCSRI